MIITDLLGTRVFGPDFLGFVSDVRFYLESETEGQPARLHGILISPHARSSSLGFERSGVRSPWPIAALVRRRHRGSFLVRWSDIERLEVGRIQLRRDLNGRHRSFLDQQSVIPALHSLLTPYTCCNVCRATGTNVHVVFGERAAKQGRAACLMAMKPQPMRSTM